MSAVNTLQQMVHFANLIAASLTLSSLRFLITKILRMFVGHISLNTLPAGDDSSELGRGGTASGFKKGNVGGGLNDDGGYCLRVGAMWLGKDTVERSMDIPRCCPVREILLILILLNNRVTSKRVMR